MTISWRGHVILCLVPKIRYDPEWLLRIPHRAGLRQGRRGGGCIGEQSLKTAVSLVT